MSGKAPSGRRRPDMSLVGMGVELAAAVVGCALLGVWIDRRWDTAPVALLILVTIGIVGGLYNFVRQATRAQRRGPSE